MTAVCTHCNNAWVPVKPTAADELRGWPQGAICPRCGYWGNVIMETKTCILCGYVGTKWVEYEVPHVTPRQVNVICADCVWEIEDLAKKARGEV